MPDKFLSGSSFLFSSLFKFCIFHKSDHVTT
nr:MAG TPA: hypothetical protein [Caudoviricetes sp.]